MDLKDRIIELLKPKCLYIYKGGSQVYPFIKNSKDIDLIVVVENQEILNECSKILIENNIRRRDIFKENIDLHLITKEKHKLILTSHLPWVSHFIQKIYDPDNIVFKYDFFEHIKDVKENLKNYLPRLKEEDIRFKSLYYTYTNLCFIKNNSYELDEEQIENINILHDKYTKENADKRQQLKDEMIKEIESWQI